VDRDIRAKEGDMTQVTRRPHLMEAMSLLGLNQRMLAERLGVSPRTVQRWAGSIRPVPNPQKQELARAVAHLDPGLAVEIALLSGATPESLGLRTPGHEERARLPTTVLVDAVVCAGAEAITLHPGAMRPALLAAFTRCQEMGLSVAEVVEALLAKRAATASPEG
jgi:transcriptional regulator with XRE-family HTH domain